MDTKDILDKGTLGTKLWDHLRKHRLSRYQWTFLEGRTRFRFLAYSNELTVVNGLCFVSLAMSWLRAWAIKTEVDWQEDWGQSSVGRILNIWRSWTRTITVLLGPESVGLPRVGRNTRVGWSGRIVPMTRSCTSRFWRGPVFSKNSWDTQSFGSFTKM